MFSRLPSPAALEDQVLAFWDEHRIFAATLEKGAGRPPFVFYEGPPTANGLPHNGHVLTRVVKDVFPRYKTMRGYHVDRKAGWDTHGLPVEVEVEKRLGIHGREAIAAFGLERFSRECMDSVFVYVKEWEELTRQIAFWVDTDEAYVTFHRSYVESVWWALARLFEKGLLYQGHKVVWWWPQGGTTLSAGEVGMGYREVDDPAITVRFVDAEDDKTSFLAWTTTPWTLPSNVGLAVGADIDYALCDDPNLPGGTLILAAARAEAYGLVPRSTVKGRELVGRRYVPLYDFGAPSAIAGTAKSDSFVVVIGEHVTTESGAGIVHTAPAFGEDDMLVARQRGLGILQWIDPEGRFTPNAGAFAGKFCKDADADIIRDLKERGLLFKREQVRHQYPFCWRADDEPLIQYARPAWFIRTTDFKDQALANNAEVDWHPEHIKDGRFGDFLRNNVDWALSRERYWGTPLNIWACEGCDHRIAPDSAAAIKALNPNAFDPNVDEHLQVHRPWIDGVVLPCAKCGGEMKRVIEVIDCWFDSGCMPFAQWGFPHQNVDRFKANFPADFIAEAVDQTRGWFYSLLMISTMLFDDDTCGRYGLEPVGMPRPYRTCLVMGHITDMEGRKESKSKGNYTSPNLVTRGRTRLDALPDPGLKPGQVGMKSDQVAALDMSPSDRVTISAEVGDAAFPAAITKAAVKPKDTVHLHPDDLDRLGLPAEGGKIWFAIPGEPPGADAFRWLFCSNNATTNTRLSMRAIRDGQREFLLRLRNVYQFFGIYAEIAHKKGQFDPNAGPGAPAGSSPPRPELAGMPTASGAHPGDEPTRTSGRARGAAPRPASERHLLDRWILHRLNRTIDTATREMDGWGLAEASGALSTFVEDLSNWYVRRSRERFWGEGPDLEDALWTLYEVLVTFAKLIAPFVPFTAEAIYRELTGPVANAPASVHLCEWPEVDNAALDDRLDADMALIRDLASLGLAARAQAKMKVRQPLHEATIVLADPSRRAAVEALSGLLTDELNVHRIAFAANAEAYVTFAVKPDFKRLGARLGKDMKLLAGKLGQLDAAAVKSALDAGSLQVDLPDGRTVALSSEDVVVTVMPRGDYQAASSPAAVVAISTVLDEDLRAEGFVRELVNRVQNVRKDLDLGYTQRIALALEAAPEVETAVKAHADYLQRETLTRDLRYGAGEGERRELEVEGQAVVAWIQAI